MTRIIRHFVPIGFLVCFVTAVKAVGPSLLFAHGYTVIPEPQNVELIGNDFAFGNDWRLVFKSAAKTNAAAEVLREDLASRFGIHLQASPKSDSASKTVQLIISPGSVRIGAATDRDNEKLAEQAYRVDLSPESISVIANAAPGLLYGAETLVQLVKTDNGVTWLPAGRIIDWPDLESRFMYWDDKAHLDHPDVLRDVLRQAAFYK